MMVRFEEIPPGRLVAPNAQTLFLGLKQAEAHTSRMDLVTGDAREPVPPVCRFKEV